MRTDAREPSYKNHPDRGCKKYPKCLECPPPRCWFEMTPFERTVWQEAEDYRKKRQCAEFEVVCGVPIKKVAEVNGETPRSIFWMVK